MSEPTVEIVTLDCEASARALAAHLKTHCNEHDWRGNSELVKVTVEKVGEGWHVSTVNRRRTILDYLATFVAESSASSTKANP